MERRLRQSLTAGYAVVMWLGLVLVSVALGLLIAKRPAETVGLAIGLVLLSPLVPRWVVLVTAILGAFVLPGSHIRGQLTYTDIVLLIYVAKSVFYLRLPSGQGRRAALAIALFAAWCWFDLFLLNDWTTATALARVSLYVAVFLCGRSEAPEDAAKFLRFIVALAVIEASLGLAGVTHHEAGRLLGTYGDPAQTGILFLAGFAATILLPKGIRLGVRIVLGLGVLATLTRSIWIAALAEMLALFRPATRSGVRIAGIVLLVGALAWTVGPTVTSRYELDPRSIPLRTESWRNGLADFVASPLLGGGWALADRQQQTPSFVSRTPAVNAAIPYSLWLNLAASTGLPGVILFGWFIAELVLGLAKDESDRSRAVLVFTIGFLVVSLGEMTVYAAAPATILFFVMSSLGGVRDQHGARENSEVGGVSEPGELDPGSVLSG